MNTSGTIHGTCLGTWFQINLKCTKIVSVRAGFHPRPGRGAYSTPQSSYSWVLLDQVLTREEQWPSGEANFSEPGESEFEC